MKRINKLEREAHAALDEIEEGFIELKKSGVKKLPKSVINSLNKLDKEFKTFEKMIKNSRKK